jgi:hypothetical protein
MVPSNLVLMQKAIKHFRAATTAPNVILALYEHIDARSMTLFYVEI